MKKFGTPLYIRYYVIRWVWKSGKAICPTSKLTIDPHHTHPPKNYINIIWGSFKQLLNDLYEEVSIRNNSIFVNFSITIECLPTTGAIVWPPSDSERHLKTIYTILLYLLSAFYNGRYIVCSYPWKDVERTRGGYN